MNDDSAVFVSGLPDGNRDGEPGAPISRSHDKRAGNGPVALPESAAFIDLDTIVRDLKAAADSAETKDTSAEKLHADRQDFSQDLPDLPAEDENLGVVSPTLHNAGVRNSKWGRRLPIAAFVSILFHGAAVAMALHVAEVLPEAPQEEGGAIVSVVMIGNGDFDAAASGTDTAEPTTVEAKPVAVEQAVAPEIETLKVAPSDPEPVTADVEQARPAEALTAPAAMADEVQASPVEAVSAAPTQATSPASVAALSNSEPEVLAVAPTESVSSDQVAPAAPLAFAPRAALSQQTQSAAVPQKEIIAAEKAQSEIIKALEDDPERSLDIAPPIPQPSPWQAEPLPKEQVATRKANAERARQKTRTAKRQSAGSGGQSNRDARKGAVSGTSDRGAKQAAEARSGTSGDGAAAMANYTGRLQAKLAGAVSVQRYYRGLGPLTVSVRVAITLNRSGNISSLSLSKSSGNSKLDAVVLQRARSAGPFGAFPKSIKVSQKSFSLPINLKLRR